MKKTIFALFVAIILLTSAFILIACGGGGRLPTPTAIVDGDDTINFVWDSNVSQYVVNVDGKDYTVNNYLEVDDIFANLSPKDYNVKLKAVGSGDFSDSDWSESINYTAAEHPLLTVSNLRFSNEYGQGYSKYRYPVVSCDVILPDNGGYEFLIAQLLPDGSWENIVSKKTGNNYYRLEDFSESQYRIRVRATENSETGTLYSAWTNVYYTVDSLGYLAFANQSGNATLLFGYSENPDAVLPESIAVGGRQMDITAISSAAFAFDDHMTSVIVPNTITTLYNNVFSGCNSLTQVSLPDSITEIGEGVFENCTNLASVNIPKSVTSLKSNLFRNCTNLTEILIPERTTSIASTSFEGCVNLTITFETKTPFGDPLFLSQVKYVLVEDDSVATFKNAWADIESKILPKSIASSNNLLEKDGTIYGYFGYDTEFTIPQHITRIADGAFKGSVSLQTVTVGDNVTSIGFGAFEDCDNLGKITLPFIGESLDSQNRYFGFIFGSSKPTNYSRVLPDSVKEVVINGGTIPDNAFFCCDKLRSITINNDAVTVGSRAFYSTRTLKDLMLPDSITSIGDGAFQDSALRSFTFPKNLVSIGASAFARCNLLSGDIIIPDTVSFIGDNAFSYCENITRVVVQSNVTSIGAAAFEMCYKLTEFDMPDSVASIGEGIFDKCQKLAKLTLSKQLVTIPAKAFKDCRALTEIAIPQGVTSIGAEAFMNTRISTINLPNGLTSLGSGAFMYSGITSIVIPQGVTVIEDSLFNQSGIADITFLGKVTSIGNLAFNTCPNLTSMTLPESVTAFGWNAFQGCVSLKSIVIPQGITSVSSGLFYGCTSLEQVTIPSGVKEIESTAFAHCQVLKSIRLPEGLTTISFGAFSDCKALTSINIPSSVTFIADDAFAGCTSLPKGTVHTIL